MVSKIIISIALLCSSVAFSQEESGLSFSQVLILDISSNQTVPDGQVWKVVSCQRSTISYSDDSYIIINGSSYYISEGHASAVAYALPLWLPSGTVVKNGGYAHKLNIIEFNTD